MDTPHTVPSSPARAVRRCSRTRRIIRASLFAIPGLAATIGGVIPHIARAQINASAIVGTFMAPVTAIIVVVGYIMQQLLGLMVPVVAWFIKLLMLLNMNVLASPMAKDGYTATLSLANMGFVIGMIVMAIMTIIRYQPYGVKQMLWRIVVMAILVNFGFVIMGAILQISDSLTMFYLTSITQPGADGFDVFSNNIGGILEPQRVFTQPKKGDPTPCAVGFVAYAPAGGGGSMWCFFVKTGGGLIGLLDTFNSPIEKQLQLIIASITGVFALLIGLIVLGIFAAMLFVRYLYIAILAILLPLAWVSWVFPAFRSHFTKWWDKFLHWAFFPPLVVFFISLSISSARGLKMLMALDKETKNPVVQTVFDKLGEGFAPIIGYAMDSFLVCGLMVAGLMAAQSLGITAAGAGVAAAQGVGKAFGGYVGRRAGGAMARRATSGPPPPRQPAKTAVGRGLQTLTQPFSWASRKVGAGVRAVAQSEIAQRRGYTETVKQYGKKTDFKEPKRLWQESKNKEAEAQKKAQQAGTVKRKVGDVEDKARVIRTDAEKLRDDEEQKKRGAKNARDVANSTRVESNKDPSNQNLKDTADRLDKEALAKEAVAADKGKKAEEKEKEAGRFDEAAKELEKAAKEFEDGAKKATSEAQEKKQKTWEAYSTNRGVAGSMWFGALKEAGLWKGKQKLKLSEEDDKLMRELLAKQGVSIATINKAMGASPVAPLTPSPVAPPPPTPAPAPTPTPAPTSGTGGGASGGTNP